jgi:hypothetical protein
MLGECRGDKSDLSSVEAPDHPGKVIGLHESKRSRVAVNFLKLNELFDSLYVWYFNLKSEENLQITYV